MIPTLTIGSTTLAVRRPLIMGVLNATTDSFSDAGRYATPSARIERADHLIDAGVDVIDVGGQSAVTNKAALTPEVEIAAVLPVIEHIRARDASLLISVDTYKPAVAEAVLDAGASIINDTSGLADLGLADVVARHDAGLVITHNRGRPKQRLTEPGLYADVVSDVLEFLEERMTAAQQRGVQEASILIDPGPDFSKTPFQTVEVMQALPRLAALGRPLLLALSNKDFIGAITNRPPQDRLAGTLAAIGYAINAVPAVILRVHAVIEVMDFLRLWAVLDGSERIDPTLELAPELRRTPPG